MVDLDQLVAALEGLYSTDLIARWRTRRAAVHLALLRQPFFESVLAETKTVESRFARNAIAPIGHASAGDLIVFKLVGKARFAAAVVQDVRSGALDEAAWALVRANATAIGVDETYLATKAAARFFALLWIADVHPLDPLPIEKRDRRGWVVLSARHRRES